MFCTARLDGGRAPLIGGLVERGLEMRVDCRRTLAMEEEEV